jgi:large-conductance mechanosensitive channel
MGQFCENQHKETYFWVFLDFFILAFILIAYKVYIFLRDILRRRRNEQREEKELARKSQLYIFQLPYQINFF